jgi:hypothetical protein
VDGKTHSLADLKDKDVVVMVSQAARISPLLLRDS